MKSFPTCSFLISTYNWPDALEVTLRSVLSQSVRADEIIVCDDGSAKETNEVIERLKMISDIPIVHVWHPDEGFQLSKIRNKGLALANGDYILQVDGDILLHKHFLRDHLSHATKNCFFSGNRFYLDAHTTKHILDHKTTSVGFIPGVSKNSIRQLRLPALQKIYARFYHWEKEYQYILGCNMGFWREDIMRINGYDEAFEGWGSEDTEMAFRLINSGVKLTFIRFGAIQYHLYHKEAKKENSLKNHERAISSKNNKVIRCETGLDQYIFQEKEKAASVQNSGGGYSR